MIKLKDILLELTDQQKELKKDYLFKRSKLESSNTVPPFDEIWEKVILNSDFYREHFGNRKDELEEYKEETLSKYFDVIHEYKKMNDDLCWRSLTLPREVDPIKLSQLGIYWAIDPNSAESHWGRYGPKYPIEVTYESVINLDNIDWAGTMFARMDETLGDLEKEIRFLKNSKIFVNSVIVVDKTQKVGQIRDEEIYINDYRRV